MKNGTKWNTELAMELESLFYKDYEKAMEKRKYWAERKKQTTV